MKETPDCMHVVKPGTQALPEQQLPQEFLRRAQTRFFHHCIEAELPAFNLSVGFWSLGTQPANYGPAKMNRHQDCIARLA